MSVKVRAKRAWDTGAYHRMTSARFRAGAVLVDFEDGTQARVAADALLPANVRDPDWTRMHVNPYEIIVPTPDGSVEIPWDSIRVLTDPTYDAHLRAMAAEEARLIGARITELRQREGLSIEELARRAEVPLDTLTTIEAGGARVSFATLERLLGAMGESLDALIVEPERPA